MKREECRSSRQKGGVSVGFEWVTVGQFDKFPAGLAVEAVP